MICVTIGVQERDETTRQSLQQLEDRKGADLQQQQLAAEVESLRAELKTARDAAVEVVDLQLKISAYERQVISLQEEKAEAIKNQEQAERQMRMASEMIAAIQRSRDESLLKEKATALQVCVGMFFLCGGS